MHLLHETLQHYAWGSTDAIPRLLGLPPTGEPVAEAWYGAHTSAPSRLSDSVALDAFIAEHPEVLGEASRAAYGDRLPFLLKILAASAPLSLQAHPTRSQAVEGFARENTAGIPVADPLRTYKDDWPKPEMVLALTEYTALCGFRDPDDTRSLFDGLGVVHLLGDLIGPLFSRRGGAALAEVFLDVLRSGDRPEHVLEITAAAERHVHDGGEIGDFAATALHLVKHYPGDPGVIVGLLMNKVVLQPGEAVHLPAGNLHCYLQGTGVEIMANSDNVVRGGLTSKHIDIDELVRVVSFDPASPDLVPAVEQAPGLWEYPAGEPEFRLWRMEAAPDRAVDLPGSDRARVVLVLGGSLVDDRGLRLDAGTAAFAPAGESVRLSGEGWGVVAAAGV